ncbi:MAG: MAPEG family protein [Myxococcales bacterium]|nr:MAPEG family protein [Myxococcales bacterium]
MRWTALYAGLLAFLYLGLAWRVVRLRQQLKQALGDGGHRSLNQAIRVHANFAEYVPFALLLLLLVEGSRAPVYLVHGIGGGLLLGRLMHAWGLTRRAGTSFGRFYGTALTFAALLVPAGYLIYQSLLG